MSKSGLFFTGVVLKNNRNLIQEEATRRRLDLLEEQINTQKQTAADKRSKDRREGITLSSAKADFTGISDDRIKSAIIKKTSEYNNFVANNYDSEDPLVQSDIQSRRDELKLFVEYGKSLDTKITKYDPLNPDAASLRYQTDDQGSSMIEVNKARIFQQFEDGTFDLKSSIASFEDDFDGQVIQDETTPGYMGYLNGIESESFIGADGNQYKGLAPGEKTQFLNRFTKNHTINPTTGTFPSTQAEKDYMTNERFVIGDQVYDGIGAYLLEEEGISDDPSAEERERFNPNNSELFDEKLHVKYVKYLGEKIWERETANRNTMLTKKPTKKDSPQQGLSQEDVDFLSGPSKSTIYYGGVQLKFDAGMYDDVTDRNIEVNIVPESLLPGQGELNEFFEKQYKDEVGSDTNKSVKGQVTRLGLTTDNVKVASVKFGKKEYLVPYESISSEIQELKKDSVGYKIGQFESGSAPQGYDTSKYNKEE